MSTALSRAFQAMNTRSIVSGEQCGLCVSIGLEGNKVIGAILHQRQPVYYKLVGLVRPSWESASSRKAAVSLPATQYPWEKS